jgi:hypothetical protein
MFWVMFNPQPEPPGSWMHTDATNPYAPVFTVPNLSNGKFGVAFDIQNAANQLSLGNEFRDNWIEYSIFQQEGTQPPKLAFTATFTFSGFSLGSDVMFNPQPEPPGFPDAHWVTFSLLSPSGAPLPVGSEVDMRLTLTDSNNNPIALQSVPEPTTMLLLCLGLMGLAGIRRKMK